MTTSDASPKSSSFLGAAAGPARTAGLAITLLTVAVATVAVLRSGAASAMPDRYVATATHHDTVSTLRVEVEPKTLHHTARPQVTSRPTQSPPPTAVPMQQPRPRAPATNIPVHPRSLPTMLPSRSPTAVPKPMPKLSPAAPIRCTSGKYESHTGNVDSGDICRPVGGGGEWGCPQPLCARTAHGRSPYCVVRGTSTKPCHVEVAMALQKEAAAIALRRGSGCRCANVNNSYKEGAECANYRDYDNRLQVCAQPETVRFRKLCTATCKCA